MTEIRSPCVRNCCLDGDDVCLGCFRTVEEIMQWGEAADKEKLAILDRALQRRSERSEKGWPSR
jgi:predicted Fe-S protein YdhL (DUF1289 family)